eukprot:CAMPEP_0180245784 /NCGR_PEP_ID=MMETSP0987-20121128/35193_1 /TAXON_ID=697907 /ORGANISM="non described non described, Strain CCMP2293" /LENGTH=81 /DNA_ID=CAMNT_0022213491 /DNA_START=44 /DNA_END=289 /DNA_ORIENTATION=+
MEKTHRFVNGFAVPNLPARSFSPLVLHSDIFHPTAATVQGDEGHNFAEIACASLSKSNGFLSPWAAGCSPTRNVAAWRDCL